MSNDQLISISEASKMLGISNWTLRRYSKDIIEPVTTQGNHRRYRLSDIEQLQGVPSKDTGRNNTTLVYVRVSSHDQKKNGDLDRQKARVLQHSIEKGYGVKYIYEEVGSGLNDNRSKLHQLFKLVTNKEINRVVVEHKDRLTRFNYKIYEVFFKSYGVEIDVIDEELNKSFEEELVQDIISVMSSYSARLYGKRSHRNKVKNNENT